MLFHILRGFLVKYSTIFSRRQTWQPLVVLIIERRLSRTRHGVRVHLFDLLSFSLSSFVLSLGCIWTLLIGRSNGEGRQLRPYDSLSRPFNSALFRLNFLLNSPEPKRTTTTSMEPSENEDTVSILQRRNTEGPPCYQANFQSLLQPLYRRIGVKYRLGW